MVFLVYAVISPITCFVIAFCFVYMGSMFRHQFVYIYPAQPDSGGKIWMNFIRILVVCLLIAEVTSTFAPSTLVLGWKLFTSSISYFCSCCYCFYSYRLVGSQRSYYCPSFVYPPLGKSYGNNKSPWPPFCNYVLGSDD
jgi:Calcium-dependent channel, 7TM region, putative phosphate